MGFFWTRQSPERDVENSTLIDEARFVVFDTELTGLDDNRDSIISIGAVRMYGGLISLGDTFYHLVRPESDLKRENVVIHGITDDEVNRERNIKDVLGDFVEYCGCAILVGHFTSIDTAFVNREMKKRFGRQMTNRVLDTFGMYVKIKNRIEGSRSIIRPADAKLYALAARYDVPAKDAHNALSDAFITAQLFQRFIPMLKGIGITTVGDLLRLKNPLDDGGGTGRFSGNSFGL